MPLALVIPLALLLAVGATVAAVWALGYRPLGPLAPLRASVTEATERAADLAREFWDWVRLGR